MPTPANTANAARVPRKPAGATLPKPPTKRSVYPHTAPTPAVNPDDLESDEALSSEDEDEDEDHEGAMATEGAPKINMLIHGPVEDDEDDESDDSYVDDESSEPAKSSTKKNTDTAMAAAAKRLKINGQKPGVSLPESGPRGPLPERAVIHADELGDSEESDEAEHTGDESMDDDDDEEGTGHESGPETSNLTHLLLGGSASDNEDSDDDGEWPQPSRKGAKTRSLTRVQSEATGRMEIDS